jgi:biopolymer transport protein ExbD
MGRHHIPDSHTSHPNVTPLIDVIMCLIIFFMLVAKIGVTTGAEEVDIPATFIGAKIDDMSNTYTLNIRADQQTSPDDVFVKALNADNQLGTLETATSDTQQNQVANVLKKFKADKPELKVIIRADANMEWQYVSPVLDACNEAGIRNIAYDTKQQ